MQVSTANDVKIYNLSSGKSVPDWLGDRQRRKLEQKNVEVRRRIQLIQDFEMPDVSHTVDISPDGRYIFASGTYKPFIRCFDFKNLSQKFERGLDSDVVKLKILSDDFSKVVILQDDRYLEMHAAYGRYFRLRIPKPGRDMDFCRESADLYVVGSTNEIYRLNLEEGVFLEPLLSESSSINCCTFSPAHQLFLAGTSDGTVEAYDHRDRKRVGVLDTLFALKNQIDELAEVTAVKWANPLHIGVGTSSGHILLYDIRTSRPLVIKDQNTGLPIKKIDFIERENDSDLVLSMDSRVLKAWHRDTGKPFSAIEPQHALNDFVRYPDSGLILMANEAPRMLQYFVPSFGTAPKWCAYLESITEELEETEQPAVYDDYKFVTCVELEQLGLSHLIGSNVLRAYMHGYFMDIRLYNKARTLTQPFAYDKYEERKLMEEVDKERDMNVVKKKKTTKSAPKVNSELAERLRADVIASSDIKGRKKIKEKKRATTATTILNDDRFARLFLSEDFEVDETSEEFARSKVPRGKKGSQLKEIEGSDNEDEEEEGNEEQVDLSHLNLDGVDNEEGSSRRKNIDRVDMSDESEEEEEEGDSDESEDEEAVEKREKAEKARKMKEKREARRMADELERERRVANKPTKFTLHEITIGETTTKFIDGDDMEDEKTAPLSSRKAAMIEDGIEDGEGREEETPFGGKSMTFQLKKKSVQMKEADVEKAKQHVKERKEERRTIGGVRKLMTPLPGNLVLNFSSRGGRGGRGRGRGSNKRM